MDSPTFNPPPQNATPLPTISLPQNKSTGKNSLLIIVIVLILLLIVGAGSYFLGKNQVNNQSQTTTTYTLTVSPTQSSQVTTPSPTQPPTETDYFACTSDSDCVSVKDGGCNCNNGGKATAINKKYIEQWEKEQPNGICITAMSDDWTCTQAEPKCESNICKLVRK